MSGSLPNCMEYACAKCQPCQLCSDSVGWTALDTTVADGSSSLTALCACGSPQSSLRSCSDTVIYHDAEALESRAILEGRALGLRLCARRLISALDLSERWAKNFTITNLMMEHLVGNALKQCWELVALAFRVGVAGMFNVMQLLIVTAGCISVGLGGSVRVVTLLATMTSQESGSKDRGAGAGQALTPCLGTCGACQESACNLFRFHRGRHDCGCTGARDNPCELLGPPVLECQ